MPDGHMSHGAYKEGYNTGLECPECASRFTKIIDSRPVPQSNEIRRRRACDNGHRFTTYEAINRKPCDPKIHASYGSRISEEWLKEIGFKWHQLDRQPQKHWLLWIGGGFLERQMFSGPEDVGLELAPVKADEAEWFCWFRSDTAGRYHRFIHLRHLTSRAELIAIISELIEYLRKEYERLDLKMRHGNHRALPEHYEAHEKAKG